MFDAEAAAAALVVVLVDDAAGAPYCASVLHSIELRKSRENDDGDMVDVRCTILMGEAEKDFLM